MSGYLLDTNCFSELVRIQPELGVVAWMEATDETLLYLSVLTLGEIRKRLTFKQLSKERRTLKLSLRCDPQEIAGNSKVTPIDLRRFDEPFAKVFEVRRNNDDLSPNSC